VDYGGTCALIGGRREVNAQHVGALGSKPRKVLGPLDQGDAVLLSLIDDSGAQGITPWGESIGIDMPDRQVTTVLRDQDERW
jgi:hypothetical protein